MAVEENVVPLDNFPANSIIMLKIHGSIDHEILVPTITDFGANPWLSDHVWENNVISGVKTRHNLDQFGVIPDLVPPGHNGADYCNPASIVTKLSKEFLSKANVVIICGLSGAEPDTNEVKDLLSAIHENSYIFQVGIKENNDDDNDVAKILKTMSNINYAFIDAPNLNDIIGLIGEQFDLKWEWSKR